MVLEPPCQVVYTVYVCRCGDDTRDHDFSHSDVGNEDLDEDDGA